LSLKDEKKRRQQGKKLNLVGEEDSGPQLFHTARVIAAQEHCTKLTIKAEQEKLKKEARKQEKDAKKKREAKDKETRAIERQIAKEAKVEREAQEKAKQEAQKKLSKVAKKGQKKSFIVILKYKKDSNSFIERLKFAEDIEVTSSVKRVINLPARYKEL
jgi:hypothetical protein